MSFNVVDMFVFMVRRWWKVLIALGVFAGLGVGLAFLLPKRYTAQVELLPTAKEPGLASAISGLQSQLGITGLTIPGAEGGQMLHYGEILRSRTVKDYVVDSTSLLSRLELEGRNQAYSVLDGMTAFSFLSPENVFVIEVQGSEPELVAEVANAYARALDHYLTHSSTTRGKHLREFIEERLSQVRTDLSHAQDSLTAFQRKHHLPMISPETGGQIEAFAELKAQAVQKELELDYMRSFSTSGNPQYEAAQRELALIQSKLASLPPVATRYLELYREFRVQQEIYMLLVQQYEQAKLMEAKDTPLISVLEYAHPPTVPSFPPKKLVVLAMLLVGLVLIVAYSMIAVYWRHVLSHPEEHEKMAKLRREIKEEFRRRKS